MYSKIVVGTDGTGTAADAVGHAADLANATGAQLIVVSAFSAPQDAAPSLADPSPTPGIEIARGLLEDVQKRYAGQVDLKTVARAGSASSVLIDCAADEGADLVLVGSKGMTGARRFVLGSVPNTVSHRAQCDVLIVHTSR